MYLLNKRSTLREATGVKLRFAKPNFVTRHTFLIRGNEFYAFD